VANQAKIIGASRGDQRVPSSGSIALPGASRWLRASCETVRRKLLVPEAVVRWRSIQQSSAGSPAEAGDNISNCFQLVACTTGHIRTPSGLVWDEIES